MTQFICCLLNILHRAYWAHWADTHQNKWLLVWIRKPPYRKQPWWSCCLAQHQHQTLSPLPSCYSFWFYWYVRIILLDAAALWSPPLFFSLEAIREGAVQVEDAATRRTFYLSSGRPWPWLDPSPQLFFSSYSFFIPSYFPALHSAPLKPLVLRLRSPLLRYWDGVSQCGAAF